MKVPLKEGTLFYFKVLLKGFANIVYKCGPIRIWAVNQEASTPFLHWGSLVPAGIRSFPSPETL